MDPDLEHGLVQVIFSLTIWQSYQREDDGIQGPAGGQPLEVRLGCLFYQTSEALVDKWAEVVAYWRLVEPQLSDDVCLTMVFTVKWTASTVDGNPFPDTAH